MSRRFCTFADESGKDFVMNRDTLALIMVWAVGVVTFFVLWAILLKVIKRISEKKRPEETAQDGIENESKDSVTPTDV